MKIVSLVGYHKLYATDSFWEDYRKLYGKDKVSYESEKRVLLTNLNLLNAVPLSELLQMQQFEKLSPDELFSIRHVSKKNPRVLFAVDKERDACVLLCCFLEKSQSDYHRAKKKAQDIVKILEVSS